MEPALSEWSRRYAVTRAHMNADAQGRTFIVAFNPAKNDAVVCCPLETFDREHPYGLDKKDILHIVRPAPGTVDLP